MFCDRRSPGRAGRVLWEHRLQVFYLWLTKPSWDWEPGSGAGGNIAIKQNMEYTRIQVLEAEIAHIINGKMKLVVYIKNFTFCQDFPSPRAGDPLNVLLTVTNERAENGYVDQWVARVVTALTLSTCDMTQGMFI